MYRKSRNLILEKTIFSEKHDVYLRIVLNYSAVWYVDLLVCERVFEEDMIEDLKRRKSESKVVT